MLTRARLRREDGSALITALMVMLVMLPIGMALLAIVDTQARNSGSERTRDRAFNLADSALTSAAFNLGRYAWPATPRPRRATPARPAPRRLRRRRPTARPSAPRRTPSSATSKLQPNLNASYDDAAYTGATWQINVCDDDPTGAGPTVWKNALLDEPNYDANGNQLVWVRSEASVGGRTRACSPRSCASSRPPALSSKYGLMTGRMNAEVDERARHGAHRRRSSAASRRRCSAPIRSSPPTRATSTHPASTGRHRACAAAPSTAASPGTLGGLGSLSVVNTLVTGGKLVQSTSPTATSAATIAQLKQQADQLGHVRRVDRRHRRRSTSPPACTIPAGANAIDDRLHRAGRHDRHAGTVGGPATSSACSTSPASKAYKALVIGSGRVVLRGNNTHDARRRRSRGLVYALNEQRDDARRRGDRRRARSSASTGARTSAAASRPTARARRSASTRRPVARATRPRPRLPALGDAARHALGVPRAATTRRSRRTSAS